MCRAMRRLVRGRGGILGKVVQEVFGDDAQTPRTDAAEEEIEDSVRLYQG